MSGLEAGILGIGLNVAMKGVSWINKVLKNEESIKKEILRAVTKKRQGLSSKSKRHISYLVIPAGCGKTTLMKNLNCITKDRQKVMTLDLDSCLSQQISPLEERKIEEAKLAGLGDATKVNEYTKIKEYYDKCITTFKDYRLILLSSDLELGYFLGVEDIVIVVPSQKFLEQITDNEALSTEKKRLIHSQWLKLISNGERTYDVYRSFDELESMIKRSYNLINKL
jgi:energy-coupling factor transporter ATP-binding protein EcfA2